MCVYISLYVYRKPLLLLLFCYRKRVSSIRGFGFGDWLASKSVFGAVSGFDFGFQVRIHRVCLVGSPTWPWLTWANFWVFGWLY